MRCYARVSSPRLLILFTSITLAFALGSHWRTTAADRQKAIGEAMKWPLVFTDALDRPRLELGVQGLDQTPFIIMRDVDGEVILRIGELRNGGARVFLAEQQSSRRLEMELRVMDDGSGFIRAMSTDETDPNNKRHEVLLNVSHDGTSRVWADEGTFDHISYTCRAAPPPSP